MSEIEKGDTVMLQGRVTMVNGKLSYVDIKGGTCDWVRTEFLQPVEPPPFKVGDRVDAAANGKNRVIDRILTIYHLKDSPDNVTHTREELTPVPPKPEYRVVRKDDELRLQRIHDNPDGNWSYCVLMSSPQAVIESAIVAWSHSDGIDADAARKLAAEPGIIGRCRLGQGHHATAIRTCGGWHVRLTVNFLPELGCGYRIDQEYLPSNTQPSSVQPKTIGEAMFPEINGLYMEKP